jgi:hypothetical protein
VRSHWFFREIAGEDWEEVDHAATSNGLTPLYGADNGIPQT